MNIRKTVETVLSAWETHDLSQTARLLNHNFISIGMAPSPLPKEDFLMFQRIHNEAFPDWKFNIRETETQGNMVYLVFQVSATHTGVYDVSKLKLPLHPIQPTGKARWWPVQHMLCLVKDGKLTHMKIQAKPGGGLTGTLEWLGVQLPAVVM